MDAHGAPDALRVGGLSKRYGRKGAQALDGLSCRFPKGAICGLVGPNGAGKTTLFSVVCGYLPADGGTVEILGEGGFDPWRLKGRLGALPQDAELGTHHTPRELLRHFGRLQGLGRAEAARDAERVLAATNLSERAGHRIGSLSHGMRRRVAVASALIGSPELVLLDEPTAGLDPVQAQALRRVLLAARGRSTLIVSSHNLAELERICDWVVLMDRGRLIREGTVLEVTAATHVVRWTLGPGEPPMEVLSAALPQDSFRLEERAEGSTLVQTATAGSDLDASSIAIAAALAAAGVPVRGVQRGESLEDSFLRDAKITGTPH